VLTKKWTAGVLIGYVLIILGETVLFRTPFDGQHFQPQLFWSHKVWSVQKEQIIANILIFIPLGILAGSLWKWKGIITGIALSIVIELLQLVSQRGLCEFDDVLHNTLGVFIGVSIYVLVETAVKIEREQ
jgi:glycopeptide antibiotics resistance protein